MKKTEWVLVGAAVLLSLACATGGKDYKPHIVSVAVDTPEGRACLRDCQRERNHCTSLCQFSSSQSNDKFFCESTCTRQYEECKLSCPDACYQDDEKCNAELDARIEARKRSGSASPRKPAKPKPAADPPADPNAPPPLPEDTGYAPYPSL